MTLQAINNDTVNIIYDAARNGVPPEESVIKLHDMGFSIIGSIRIIREVYNVSLAKAKMIVANHPVWKKMSEAAISLHEEIENCLPDALSSNKDVEDFSIRKI